MIKTDKTSPIPLYKQILLNIKKDILLGKVKEGDKLPAVRQLSQDLKVNVNTVLKAYNILALEGFIESRQGTGNFIKKPVNSTCDINKEILNLVNKAKECSIGRDLVMIMIQEVWNELNENT
jgi:DNA-binding transcriptional regulator YhcF (GntR family)